MAFDPAPAYLEDVIASPWLETMLQQRYPGARVQGVQVVEILATQATKVRIALDIEGHDEAPVALCIKGVLTDTGASPASSLTETRFYRHMARTLPLRLPDCEHAALSDDGTRGIVVMRDLIVEGAQFCSALTPFTPEQAAAGLDLLATLHHEGGESAAPFAASWVSRFLDMIVAQPILPTAMLQQLLDGPRGDPLDPALRDADRLQRALPLLAGRMQTGRQCLLHGDVHAGNWFHDAQRRPGLVDWQVLQKGHWAQDIAYFIAAVLPPEMRRAHERPLLQHYLDRVAAAGAPTVDPDRAWDDYRAAMVYGFYLWAITRKVEPTITHEFVYRLGQAVSDLESFVLLGV